MSILTPSFPGYLSAMLLADRSNMTAPISVHTQCTNIFLPVPRGPDSNTDLIRGAFSCTAGEPMGETLSFHSTIVTDMYWVGYKGWKTCGG